MSPTPGTRRSSSMTRVAAKLPSSSDGVVAGLRRQRDDHQEAGERLVDLDALAAHLFRQPRLDARSRFCTSICATSMSVPDVEGDGDRRACRSTGWTTTCRGSPRRRSAPAR